MKKFFFMALLVLCIFPVKVHAVDYRQEIENIMQDYNLDIDVTHGFSLENIYEKITDSVKEKAEQPLQITAKIIGMILLCSVISTIQPPGYRDNIPVAICTLIIYLILLTPMQQIICMINENLVSVRNFMVSFLPVFAGISVASGEVVTSTVSTGIFLSGMVFAANMCTDIILPSVSIYFALIVSDAVSPYIRLKSIGDFYLKMVRWTMRSIVSVICFLLTVQTAVSQGSDTLAVKTGRFLAGNAIPVIGGALQDAVASVFAGMESIKGFAGAVGMAGVAMIFLPSLIMLAIYRACLNLAYICCDMFEMNSAAGCIKGFMDITELMISVVFLFMIMLIFSLTIMISMTNGV